MNKRFIYGLLAVLIFIYLVSVFIIQPDASTLTRYNLNATQLRILSLAIVLPVFAFWFAAVYSLIKINRYAETIKKTPEGGGFKYLAWGVAVLGFGLPVNSVISRLLAYQVNKDEISQATMTIITTHLTVLVPLVSFILLLIGSRKLVGTLKKTSITRTQIIWVAVAVLVVSIPYLYAVLMNPSRTVPVAPATQATYYMPDWLIVTTIALPYITVWACGFYTALFLTVYQRKVGGKIYKQALQKLNIGFLVVILSYIFLQFATAATTVISGWGLNALLVLLFVLLVVMAIGYINIALGAKHLHKLEEVT